MKEYTIDDVISALQKEYECALENPVVKKPLCYALYNTWKQFERKERKRGTTR